MEGGSCRVGPMASSSPHTGKPYGCPVVYGRDGDEFSDGIGLDGRVQRHARPGIVGGFREVGGSDAAGFCVGVVASGDSVSVGFRLPWKCHLSFRNACTGGQSRNQSCAMAVPAMLEHGRDARGTKSSQREKKFGNSSTGGPARRFAARHGQGDSVSRGRRLGCIRNLGYNRPHNS